MEDQIEALISAIENSTRREILRELTSDTSYAMELSKLVGVSQQAINKHLFLLERANLIRLMQDPENGRKKIYSPTGFSSLIIDYSRNFFNITKKDIYIEDSEKLDTADDDLFTSLAEINRQIEEITNRRLKLLATKDQILERIHAKVNSQVMDPITRKIVNLFIESMDENYVAERMGMPLMLVDHILKMNGIKKDQ